MGDKMYCRVALQRRMEQHRVSLALAELGRQLAIGAALTSAYNEGARQAAAALVEQLDPSCIGRRPWFPGCGKPTP